MSHIDWQDVWGGEGGRSPGELGGGGAGKEGREAGVLRRRTSFIKCLILAKK